jgi:hypothetical protein
MYSFHENQTITAQEIIGLMMALQTMCMVLLAQMQSGKTGTYLKVALESVKNGHVDHVLIISGSHDTSLRGQTRQDLKDAIESDCTSVIYGRSFLDIDLSKKLTERIQIYWSQDLSKITEIKGKTLIIHDESHAAQSKNNMPYRNFYKSHKLEKVLYGDDSQLKARKIWLLNVSATPFSELACNEKVKQDCLSEDERNIIGDIPLSEKSFIFGQPGTSFKGVSQFLANGSIHFESESITNDSHEHISRVLLKSKYDKKYCIVRPNCAIKDEELMKTIARNTGCEYLSVFASKSGEDPSKALDFLKVEPEKKTLVHICGKARMGQVLDKTHIGMVYEQAQNPNTDTILQGLLGRMCGYYDTPIPDIFLSSKTKTAVTKYAEAWDQTKIEELLKIRKAMNLKGSIKNMINGISTDKDGNHWQPAVPIKFKILQIDKDFGGQESYKNIDNNDLVNLFEDHPELISNNLDKDTIITSLRVKNVGHRDIEAETYSKTRNTKDKLECAFRRNTREVDLFSNVITQKHTSDVKPFTVIGNSKEAFLIGFVRYTGKLECSLPTVLSKANYAISSVETEDGETMENINGGQVIRFPFATSTLPRLFCSELWKAVKRTDPSSKTYIMGVCKSIMSMHDKSSSASKGILLSTTVYNPNNISNIVDIVEKRCNAKLTLKKSRGRPPKGYIRYSSISWRF